MNHGVVPHLKDTLDFLNHIIGEMGFMTGCGAAILAEVLSVLGARLYRAHFFRIVEVVITPKLSFPANLADAIVFYFDRFWVLH